MLSYDAHFCHKCMVQGLQFSAFDQQLYVTTLNATAGKVTTCRCFQCQHFDLEVIDCPFPLGASLEKDLAMKKAAQGQQGQGMYRQQQQYSAPGALAPNSLPSITRAGRSALNFNQIPAASLTAEGLMCAGTVSRTSQLQIVILQAQSPSI